MEPDILDLDAPVEPGAAPGLSFGDLLRYAPLIVMLAADIEAAIAKGGTVVFPSLKLKVHGHRLTLEETITVAP